MYLWLCWVFAVHGLFSSWGKRATLHSSSAEHSSRYKGSGVMALGLSCSKVYGIFLDQGSNLCSLHWQVDSQPLDLQGSPVGVFKKNNCIEV